MFARKLISRKVRGATLSKLKRSKTFSVGLPQTVCAFVCGLSVEEIIPSKDDARDKSTIFYLVLMGVRTHVQRQQAGMQRDACV